MVLTSTITGKPYHHSKLHSNHCFCVQCNRRGDLGGATTVPATAVPAVPATAVPATAVPATVGAPATAVPATVGAPATAPTSRGGGGEGGTATTSGAQGR